MNTLYVGNISYEASEQDLMTLFERFGEVVRLVVPKDHTSGQPRGICFVTFTAEASARAALDDLEGLMFLGRVLKVAEAHPQAPGPRR